MNYGGAILDDMARLLELFQPYCADRTTLDWLRDAVEHRGQWTKAHGIFQQIRDKTLKAEKSGNRKLTTQYLFEEVCAKTLYNLSRSPAPFDPDSPYWVVPNALAWARCVGLADTAVLACIGHHEPP